MLLAKGQEANSYRLAIDGDDLERHYWGLFVKDQFPSYEMFWLKFVVPLTNRPGNINFKTDTGLAKINKSKLDISIAQLNYSIFRHLMRCFDISIALEKSTGVEQQLNFLQEGIIRLVGAQDNAFELLERINKPCCYDPFSEKDGEIARKTWQQNKKYPLRDIRNYRNNLIHGRLLPGIIDGSRLCLPKIGKESKYLDWRLVTELSNKREEYKKDFISVLNILKGVWNETVSYLESNWKDL